MAVSAGYFHELTGGDGAWGRLVLEQDLGRARLAFAVHGEHVFAAVEEHTRPSSRELA